MLQVRVESPILDRLRYLIEYSFAGDFKKFERQFGLYRRQPEYILRGQAKIPYSLLAALVVDYGVSARWLLTGTTPVFETTDFLPVSSTVAPTHELFDPTSMFVRRQPVEVPSSAKITKSRVPELAAAVFGARVHSAPVLLLLDWPAMQPEPRQAVVQLLREKYVTALAATTRALYKDAGKAAPRVISVARKASRCGMGLGSSVGRWLKLGSESVFSVAYAHRIPASVYYQPGDDYRYFENVALGPTVGAELGAVTQVDLFLFAEQIRLFITTEHSVCIDTTKNQSMTALLTNTVSAAQRTTDKRHGSLFKLDSKLLPSVLQSCQTVFKGNHSAGRRNFRF